MIFHFSIYHAGSHEEVDRDLRNIDSADAEAWKLLSNTVDHMSSEIEPGDQVRIVTSDRDNIPLFTLSYVAATVSGESRDQSGTEAHERPLGTVLLN